VKSFCSRTYYLERLLRGFPMKTEDAKNLLKALRELNESYEDTLWTMKETIESVKATKTLWRQKNNSMLIKVGLALIAFPDPTISDILGALLVAAGTVQQGIKRRTIYVEDVYKNFSDTLKEIYNLKNNIGHQKL
ncbi:MAG: hypothetical protein QXM86_05255, partial [Candidatus Bathyarchaeia archaeon]